MKITRRDFIRALGAAFVVPFAVLEEPMQLDGSNPFIVIGVIHAAIA